MPQNAIAPGMVIDGFLVGEKLHQGGMAEIWSVSKAGIDVPLCMKVPLILEGDDPTMIVGFEQEQLILPRLTGPHVPKVFAIGDFSTRPHIVMERIAGQSLLSTFKAAPIDLSQLVEIGARVALALANLHRQDVVHLDLKPSNIMFRENGDAVFIDFGLSRHLKLPDLLAEEFRVPMGTAPYMSPEQVLKIREEPLSDIFALGAILYALATGERPLGNPKHTTKALMRRLYEVPTPPRALRSGMPGFLQEIILRCLEVNPEKRFPSASQLAFALRHPEHVVLTERATRLKTHWLRNALAGRFRPGPQSLLRLETYRHAASAPIIMVAVDLSPEGAQLATRLRDTTQRMMATAPESRLAVTNVLKTNAIGLDQMVDTEGNSLHIQRLVALKGWAQEIHLPPERLTFHVLEASDPADAMITFARNNHIDHMIVGARGSGGMRRFLGSVSTAIVAGAPCDVTVVRARHEGSGGTEEAG
jgi:serine/threonine protein kinase